MTEPKLFNVYCWSPKVARVWTGQALSAPHAIEAAKRAGVHPFGLFARADDADNYKETVK